MVKHIRSFLPSVMCGLTFLLAAASAQAQYELRCRGGSEAFAIDGVNATTLSLNFSASVRPAGVGEGLEAGTCSWLDRVVSEAEPRQIQFGVSGSDGMSIRRYLNSPNNYWSFIVVNTNRGYFEASSNKVWNDPSAADVTASPGSTVRAGVTAPPPIVEGKARKPNVDLTAVTPNPSITTRTVNADMTARRRQTGADVTGRPSAKSEGLAGYQLFRDVKVKELKAQSFTVYVTTAQPARVEVRAGLGSRAFGLRGYSSVDLVGGMGSETKTDHRMAVRVTRVGLDPTATLPPGGTLKLFIRGYTEDGRGFDYTGDFIVPPPE